MNARAALETAVAGIRSGLPAQIPGAMARRASSWFSPGRPATCGQAVSPVEPARAWCNGCTRALQALSTGSIPVEGLPWAELSGGDPCGEEIGAKSRVDRPHLFVGLVTALAAAGG